ncbi:MAG TPA: response regulator transcription factor [Ferruginibacter sp.]|nr:response regulator transcription factor [Ferruginibacter sp.]
MPLKILIFEDNVALRQSLKTLLMGVEGYEVSGDYSNCKNAKEITETILPDIVIMDIDMPEVNGIEGLKIIKETKPDTQIIMHTVFDDDQRLFDCLCHGASGYILKNTTFSKLIEAIDTVQKGGSPLSPLIARKVLNSFHQVERTNTYQLSKRELEILGLMVQGFSYKMIADACFISIDTVRGHIRNIYNKLHVNCGREAVVKALKDKIVH